jgi:hypothetical protein
VKKTTWTLKPVADIANDKRISELILQWTRFQINKKKCDTIRGKQLRTICAGKTSPLFFDMGQTYYGYTKFGLLLKLQSYKDLVD